MLLALTLFPARDSALMGFGSLGGEWRKGFPSGLRWFCDLAYRWAN